MIDRDVCNHLSAVESQLPESSVSARIALSCLLGEYVRLQSEVEALRIELEKRPRLLLLQGGAA